MRGIEFVGWGFVVLITLVASTLLPYLVLFGLRRRERVGCGRAIGVVVVSGLIAFGVAMALRPSVVASLTVPRIQAALDGQCGEHSEPVSAVGFVMTPYYSWLGEEAGCQYIDYTSAWECYCTVDAP